MSVGQGREGHGSLVREKRSPLLSVTELPSLAQIASRSHAPLIRTGCLPDLHSSLAALKCFFVVP